MMAVVLKTPLIMASMKNRAVCFMFCLMVTVGSVWIGSPLVSGKIALANGLEADVSDRLIAITTAFVGGSVVVFGAADDPKSNVVITMQGPRQSQMVRRKSRVAGIWINSNRLAFNDVPSY